MSACSPMTETSGGGWFASGRPFSCLCLVLSFLLQRHSGRCRQTWYRLNKHLWIVVGFLSFCARISDHHEAPQWHPGQDCVPSRGGGCYNWGVGGGVLRGIQECHLPQRLLSLQSKELGYRFVVLNQNCFYYFFFFAFQLSLGKIASIHRSREIIRNPHVPITLLW